jgi:hypothetical protein
MQAGKSSANGHRACSRAARAAAVFSIVTVLAAQGANAQTGCQAVSGETRVAMMDVMRGPVSSDLRTSVQFVVERARMCGAWAFVLATPQRPGGGEVRWAGTPCQGDTSHLVGALLRQQAGVWRLVDYALCPSDVAWADWPRKYKAPEQLFQE